MNKIFTKRKFKKYIIKHKRKNIDSEHIDNIVSILLDELIKEILIGNKIEIKNLGSFELKQLNDRWHINITTKERVLSKGKKTVKLAISDKFGKFLCDNLDWEKTFGHAKES